MLLHSEKPRFERRWFAILGLPLFPGATVLMDGSARMNKAANLRL